MSNYILQVDCRESKLIAELTKLKVVFQTESLSIGDIIISELVDGVYIEKIIFERKTLADLSSSITDGRYTEQSVRLDANSLHNHNKIYLIEGNLSTYKDSSRIYSTITSILMFKGFSVLTSLSIVESAKIINGMFKKLETESNKSTSNKRNMFYSFKVVDETIPQVEYATTIKKIKKDNINAENIGVIMLSQIPSVSTVVAGAILGKFKTLPNLIIELSKDPLCIDGLTSTNSKGQIRKINKTCIASIKTYLTLVSELSIEKEE